MDCEYFDKAELEAREYVESFHSPQRALDWPLEEERRDGILSRFQKGRLEP